MMLSPWLIGGLIGLAVGAFTFFILGNVVSKMGQEGRIERGHPGYVLDLVRKLDLLTLPIIGAIIGHYAFGGSQ